MVHRLTGRAHLGAEAGAFAGIQVALVAREVAARDLDSDPVPGLEDVAGLPQVDRVFVNLAGLNRPGLVEGRSQPPAPYALTENDGAAVRIHVHQSRGEIGVRRISGGVDGGGHGAGYLQIPLERIGRVDQHVGAPLDAASVPRSERRMHLLAANGGHRVGRVVDESVR